jgi:fumarate hydratase subunit beta
MTTDTIKTHRLTFPISETDAREVRVGDQVIIDGEIIITAGLPTHERLLKCLDGHEKPPMNLKGASLFHLGGYGREVGNGIELVYINPTTSTRFNPMMPRLIEGFGWHAVGGKGGLDDACTRAMQDVGCIYLSFLGGGATLLSRAIKEVLEVGWSDMLLHYRLTRVRVEGLGPTTVGIDAHGRSLYAEQQETAQARIPDLMAQLDSARRNNSQL